MCYCYDSPHAQLMQILKNQGAQNDLSILDTISAVWHRNQNIWVLSKEEYYELYSKEVSSFFMRNRSFNKLWGLLIDNPTHKDNLKLKDLLKKRSYTFIDFSKFSKYKCNQCSKQSRLTCFWTLHQHVFDVSTWHSAPKWKDYWNYQI